MKPKKKPRKTGKSEATTRQHERRREREKLVKEAVEEELRKRDILARESREEERQREEEEEREREIPLMKYMRTIEPELLHHRQPEVIPPTPVSIPIQPPPLSIPRQPEIIPPTQLSIPIPTEEQIREARYRAISQTGPLISEELQQQIKKVPTTLHKINKARQKLLERKTELEEDERDTKLALENYTTLAAREELYSELENITTDKDFVNQELRLLNQSQGTKAKPLNSLLEEKQRYTEHIKHLRNTLNTNITSRLREELTRELFNVQKERENVINQIENLKIYNASHAQYTPPTPVTMMSPPPPSPPRRELPFLPPPSPPRKKRVSKVTREPPITTAPKKKARKIRKAPPFLRPPSPPRAPPPRAPYESLNIFNEYPETEYNPLLTDIYHSVFGHPLRPPSPQRLRRKPRYSAEYYKTKEGVPSGLISTQPPNAVRPLIRNPVAKTTRLPEMVTKNKATTFLEAYLKNQEKKDVKTDAYNYEPKILGPAFTFGNTKTKRYPRQLLAGPNIGAPIPIDYFKTPVKKAKKPIKLSTDVSKALKQIKSARTRQTKKPTKTKKAKKGGRKLY